MCLGHLLINQAQKTIWELSIPAVRRGLPPSGPSHTRFYTWTACELSELRGGPTCARACLGVLQLRLISKGGVKESESLGANHNPRWVCLTGPLSKRLVSEYSDILGIIHIARTDQHSPVFCQPEGQIQGRFSNRPIIATLAPICLFQKAMHVPLFNGLGRGEGC